MNNAIPVLCYDSFLNITYICSRSTFRVPGIMFVFLKAYLNLLLVSLIVFKGKGLSNKISTVFFFLLRCVVKFQPG
jgi:hypothetical protein